MNSLKAAKEGQSHTYPNVAVGISCLTLCVPHHCGILLLVIRQAPNETAHVECEQLTVLLLLLVRPTHVLAIGKQQAGKATDKGGADSIGVEGHRAYQTDEAEAAVVSQAPTTTALEQPVSLGSVVTDVAV